VTTTTTTYGAAPACTPTTSSSEDTSGCVAIDLFPPCKPGACPAGSTDKPAGCVVESSIQNCTGGRITIQSQYNYYLPNLDAPGPATCPWIHQSKALICGGCTNPAHTFNVATQNCEAPCNPGPKPQGTESCAMCYTNWSGHLVCTPRVSGPGHWAVRWVPSADGCSWVRVDYRIIDCDNRMGDIEFR
jgi:hypothetical protein